MFDKFRSPVIQIGILGYVEDISVKRWHKSSMLDRSLFGGR